MVAKGSPSDLDDLRAAALAGTADWLIDLVLPAIGGGRLAPSELDVIARQPEATTLNISGLDQPTFEALVDRYGHQFTALRLWKCPRIEDFSPLEAMPALTFVSIFWNQRAHRLWDLSKTPMLRGLGIEDFTRLRTLDDLARARSLEDLRFGDGMWVKATVDSLQPLADLLSLRHLSFAVRKIEDGRVQPLASLQSLETFDCSANLFTTEQLAWLRAHLPDTTRGRVLEPIQVFDDRPVPGQPPPRNVLVMGKRKPFLNAELHADKIQRYVDDYWRLVEKFRAEPSLEPASA